MIHPNPCESEFDYIKFDGAKPVMNTLLTPRLHQGQGAAMWCLGFFLDIITYMKQSNQNLM